MSSLVIVEEIYHSLKIMQVLYDLVKSIWISIDKSVHWKSMLESFLLTLFFITKEDNGELESGLGGFWLNREVDPP